MNEIVLTETFTSAEIEFLKNVFIAFVAYGEKASQTHCWKGLEKCFQNQDSITWIAFETGLAQNRNTESFSQQAGSIFKILGNPGLGICFNQAAERAKTLGKKWLLFFDSDYEPSVQLFKAYAQSSFEKKFNICIPQVINGSFTLSPYQTFFGRYRNIKIPQAGILLKQNWFWINNGLLVQLDLFEKAGRYHPDTIADFSDSLFCYRVQKLTPDIYLMPIQIEHRHSAFDQMNIQKALSRFRIYCLGAKIMGSELNQNFRYFFWTFMRACLLCVRFRTIASLPILFESKLQMLKKTNHA